MSMVINLVEDHNIYLCEGGPVYNGGVQPITYLTQWKIVGNSEVHTDPFLTSWKVLGNSVVDNNTILSCGDLGQDGKYHVKISDGSNVYDIALTEPLRKVNDVADTIEFPSNTEGKALVTRNIMSGILGEYTWSRLNNRLKTTDIAGMVATPSSNSVAADIICATYPTLSTNQSNLEQDSNIAVATSGNLFVYDTEYPDITTAAIRNQLIAKIQDMEVIFRLATPTTELIDVSPFPVSPTDTYTSANATPYSAFEYTKHSEIWSCGEYNPTDGKYHILVQPQGGSIADIALTEPLRMVNDVADTIEFPSDTEGKALVTRNFMYDTLDDKTWQVAGSHKVIMNQYWRPYQKELPNNNRVANILVEGYTTYSYTSLATQANAGAAQSAGSNGSICLYDDGYIPESGNTPTETFYDAIVGKHILLELATPTTELIDAPQIEEAESYTCVISQGGKAVSWSSFETE